MIHAVVKRLKNHKSPEEDGLPPEIFKGCSDALVPATPRHRKGMGRGDDPGRLECSVILPLFKKGDREFIDGLPKVQSLAAGT